MRNIFKYMYELEAEKRVAAGRESTLAEMRDMFRLIDNRIGGVSLDPDGVWDAPDTQLSEAMVTANFQQALLGFVERRMTPGYQTVRFDFEQFVKPDETPNFFAVSRLQNRQGVPDLQYQAEKGEPRPGSMADATPHDISVQRWSEQFDFSFEALVNDDLGYFDNACTLAGQAARRTLEKFVSRMLWNATSLAYLVGLGALYSSNGRLTTARVSTARMAFAQRVDAAGEPVAAELAFIIHHRGLGDTVDTIRSSQLVPELATNAANVVGTRFKAIADPYVTGATATAMPWFATSNYRMDGIVPFTLARLRGRPAPRLYRRTSNQEVITTLLGAGTPAEPILGDFETGNVVFKVEDIWGTYVDPIFGNVYDPRGCFYSSGTAA